MEISNLIPHIEALIFASDKPLTAAEITELMNLAFGFMEEKIEPAQVDAAIGGIVEKYQSEFYPFEVRESGGGWQFLTKKDFHKTVAQLNGEKFLKRLSAAALETLAIVAYKQPVTKGEIESIRGVSSDYAVQKLLEKELIVISGRNEKLPGHPLVYVTSKSFMDYFGINTAQDLPRIREVLAEQMVQPTVVHPTDFEQSEAFVVSEEGELIEEQEKEKEKETEHQDEKEEHINGHSFPLVEDEGSEESGEEESTEKFIADESSIDAGDEETKDDTEDASEDPDDQEDSEEDSEGYKKNS